MHVAHFIHRYPPAIGGAEGYFARLSEFHASHSDDVIVWTTTAVDLAAMWHSGKREVDSAEVLRTSPKVEIRRYRPLHFPARRYVLKALTFVPHRTLQALAMPCNPVCPGMWRDAAQYDGPLDAVHASAFPYAFPIVCGLRLARRRKVPFLLTPFLHLGDPTNSHDRMRKQYTSGPLRWLLRQADRVFVQTPSEQQAAHGLGVPMGKIVLQGLGVEPSECTGGDRQAARKRWGIRSDEFVVGHLANLSEEKGTVDLLRAAQKCWKEGEPIRVVLGGPSMPNFEHYWKSLGTKDTFLVTRLGVLTDSEKRDFFASLDVFALPSRTDSFGLVLLEAWANGLPVVAYRAGGPADLVRDVEDGFVVDCGDVEKLGFSLWYLFKMDAARRLFGEMGRERVERDFRWDDKLRIVRETIRNLRQSPVTSP